MAISNQMFACRVNLELPFVPLSKIYNRIQNEGEAV